MSAGRSPAARDDIAGATAPGEALLAVRDVSKQFGGTQALDRVGMHLNAGEIVALLGENGAGKSTLIKILAGVYSLDAGQVTLPRPRRDGARCAGCRSPSSTRTSA